MGTELTPGNYFIEMAFRRPVSEDTLARVLASMGFTAVEFDKNEDVAVGAMIRATTTASTATSARPAAVFSQSVQAAPRAAQQATAFRVSASSPSLTINQRNSPALVTSPPLSRTPRGAPSSPAPTSDTSKSATVDSSTAVSDSATKTAAYDPSSNNYVSRPGRGDQSVADQNDGGSDSVTDDGRGGESDDAATSKSEPPGKATPSYMDKDAPRAPDVDADSSKDNAGPDSPVDSKVTTNTSRPTVDDAGPSAPERSLLARMSTEMTQAMSRPSPVQDRWRRWVEWGSPFATAPAYLVNVSGEEETAITRFRFVATLTRTFTPTNLTDMSWVFIRRLTLDPFADLKFQLTPFRLERGGLYEFRFFSRIKSNPTKDSVKETLALMGFSPMKLNLLKKNMRIPRRGNVSVCMWLGIGRWNAPNSVVTTEDPFFFENVKAVQP